MPRPQVILLGGTGTVGSALTPALLAAGFAVVTLSRSGGPTAPPETPHLRHLKADVFAPESWQAVLSGAWALIDCIGILLQTRRARYQNLIVDACQIALTARAAQAIPRFVFVSAAPPPWPLLQGYRRAKAQAEALVQAQFPAGLIVRPQIVLTGSHPWLARLPWFTPSSALAATIIDYLQA